jgi:hypothetical protein
MAAFLSITGQIHGNIFHQDCAHCYLEELSYFLINLN